MKKVILISLILSFILFVLLYPFFTQLVSYLHPIVLVVVGFCIFVSILFICLLILKKSVYFPLSYFSSIFILYTIALLILLFFRPDDQDYHSINLLPFATINYYLTGKVEGIVSFYNLAANIGLFIPYGILLKVKSHSVSKLIIIPILFISLIESFQFITHRGSLDIDDLILNLLGVYIGCLLYPLFKRVFQLY